MNNMIEKHVINIMDCYCGDYDNKRRIESSDQVNYKSIYDKDNKDKFDETITKITKLVCDNLEIDYNTVTEAEMNRIKSNLIITHQYRIMHNQIADREGLLRYLTVFYKSVNGVNSNDELSQEQKDEFRKIYLAALVDGAFDEYVEYYDRFTNLRDKVDNKTITPAETKEMYAIDKVLGSTHRKIDLEYAVCFEVFNRVIEKKNVINDREYFKYAFNKSLMRIINPTKESLQYAAVVENYAKEDGQYNTQKFEEIKGEVGLFFGRIALMGNNNDKNANISLIPTVEKLDGDNIDIMLMLNTYFKMYNQGYEQYNYLIKKI